MSTKTDIITYKVYALLDPYTRYAILLRQCVILAIAGDIIFIPKFGYLELTILVFNAITAHMSDNMWS